MKNNRTLRKAIIKALVTGQTSKHNDNDLSAFSLADSIRKEQETLLAKKEINKQKNDNKLLVEDNRYFLIENGVKKEVDEETINLLPKNWTLLTQKELFWLENGAKTSGDFLPLLDARFLRTKTNAEMINNGVIVDTEDKIILVDGENSGELFVPHVKGYMGSTFKILKFTKLMDYDFLVLVLKASQERYRSNKTGIAIPHLNKVLFRNDLAFIPPIDEQRRIVEKYNLIAPLLDEYEELELKRSIVDNKLSLKLIKAIIKYELDESNSNEKGWDRKKLSDIGTIVGGGTPDTNTIRYWENGTIEWITPADMNTNLNYELPSSRRKITIEGLNGSSAKLMEPGAIIMSSRAPIGYLGINKVPTCTSQGCKSLVITNTKKYYNKFVYFAIYNALPDIIESASNMTFKEISGSKFGEITISIPDFAEQNRIVNKIEKLLSCIKGLQ